MLTNHDLNELKNRAQTEDIKWYVSIFEKNKDNLTLTEAEHIFDYFHSNESPKRLKKMSLKVAKEKAKEWTERLIKKAGEITETEQDTVVIKTFNDGLRLVKLVNKAAFEREGNLMRHCVASYYDKSDVTIYSIRDINNNPHCTIEVQGTDNVNQIKGKGNGSIHPKYISAVISSLEFFGLKVRETELSNLGYQSLSGELMRYIEQKFDNHKWLTFNNKKFFYIKSNLKLKGQYYV